MNGIRQFALFEKTKSTSNALMLKKFWPRTTKNAHTHFSHQRVPVGNISLFLSTCSNQTKATWSFGL